MLALLSCTADPMLASLLPVQQAEAELLAQSETFVGDGTCQNCPTWSRWRSNDNTDGIYSCRLCAMGVQSSVGFVLAACHQELLVGPTAGVL